MAITRARREMVVFASFPPGLVDLNRTSSEAVRDLKHFLEFAERGPKALGEAVAGSVGGFESPFEEAVARGLRERGWTPVPQIGVSRFRIDLGIVNPDCPGEFLVGVECDGASYHSAATARDRDKVREGVLAGLGWRLVRVWSTDWWVDKAGALDRLDAALRSALEVARVDAAARLEREAARPPSTGNMPALDDSLADGDDGWENKEASQSLGGSYRLATFDSGFVVDPARFQEPGYSVNIRAMIQHVIETEAPLRDDLLVERIARAHGFRRSGRAIRERVMTLVRGTAHLEVEEAGTTIVWPDAHAADQWSEARYPATVDDIRSIEDIPTRELAAALRSCATGDKEGEASRAFGLRRLSASARERLRRAIPPDGHMAG